MPVGRCPSLRSQRATRQFLTETSGVSDIFEQSLFVPGVVSFVEPAVLTITPCPNAIDSGSWCSGTIYGADGWTFDASPCDPGYDGGVLSHVHSFQDFLQSDLPPDSVGVVSAVIRVKATESEDSQCAFEISLCSNHWPSAPSGGETGYTSLAWRANPVTWNAPAWAADQWYESPDLSALCQAHFDDGAYWPSAQFGFLIKSLSANLANEGSRHFYSAANGVPANAPQLVIKWLPKGSVYVAPPASGPVAVSIPSSWRVQSVASRQASWLVLDSLACQTLWFVSVAVVCQTIWLDTKSTVQQSAWNLFSSLARTSSWHNFIALSRSLAWHDTALASRSVVWRDFVASPLAFAWHSLAASSRSVAWRSFVSASHASAWHDSTLASRQVSWRAHTLAGRMAAWHDATGKPVGTAWNALALASRATAWRSLAALDLAASWHDTVAASQATSWQDRAVSLRQTTWLDSVSASCAVSWRDFAFVVRVFSWHDSAESARLSSWHATSASPLSAAWDVNAQEVVSFEVGVSSSADDGFWTGTMSSYSNFNNGNSEVYLGYRDSTNNYNPFVLFRNVAIQKGASASNSRLRFAFRAYVSSAPTVRIHAVLSDNPSAPANARACTKLVLSSEYVEWTIPAGLSQYANCDSPDISSLVTLLASRAGWVSGNSMLFVILPSPAVDGQCVWLYSVNGGYAPSLKFDVAAPIPPEFSTSFPVSWHSLASASRSFLWRISFSKPQTFAWHDRVSVARSSVWNDLSVKSLASSWCDFSVIQKSLAWRDFNAHVAQTAWQEFAASVLASAWDFRNGFSQQASWLVSASQQRATAWQDRAAASRRGDWRDFALLSADSAWHDLRSDQLSSGWLFSVIQSLASSWNVLHSHDLLSAYDVRSDRTLASSWKFSVAASIPTGWKFSVEFSLGVEWGFDQNTVVTLRTLWAVQTSLANYNLVVVGRRLQSTPLVSHSSPAVGVARAPRPAPCVGTLPKTQITITRGTGGSVGTTDLSYYGSFLQIDGGNPFSRFSEEIVGGDVNG